MAKQEQNAARTSAIATSNQAQSDLAPVIQGQQDQQKVAQQRQGQSYDSAMNNYNTASGGYKDFAATGGFTPAEETNYLNRATSGVTNTGTALEQQAQLNRSKTGGAGTGGEVSQIARQLGQRQSDATNQAQMNLSQQKNQNKLAGLGGLNSVAGGQSQLFNTNTGEVSDMGHQVLQSLGLKYQTEAQANQLLAQLSNNPGTFDNILRTITAVKGGGGGGGGGAADYASYTGI